MKKGIHVSLEKNDEQALAIRKAQIETSPHCRGYLTISRIVKDDLNLQTLYDNIRQQSVEVTEKDNLQFLEETLVSQTQALQSIFHHAAERIFNAKNMEQFRTYGDLAIKANGACRKTISAITHLKNPAPTMFIKQQNNAMNQQILNTEIVETKKIKKSFSNELLSLEEKSNETVDARRKTAASRANSKLETLAKGWGEDS